MVRTGAWHSDLITKVQDSFFHAPEVFADEVKDFREKTATSLAVLSVIILLVESI